MILLDEAPCERCANYTTFLTQCDHFELCEDCRMDHGCPRCRPGDNRLLNARLT